jgi:hypothetical protein
MTGLIARRARLESRDDGSDVVTSQKNEFPRLARCSVFKDRFHPASEGLSVQARTASRATTQYIGEIALDPADQARPPLVGLESVAARASR